MKAPKPESIQTDCHQVVPGDWFLPMTIKDINQHSLIPLALERGALGFTAEAGQALPTDMAGDSFTVPSLRDYLFSRAQDHRKDLPTQVAVITGSAGKTSIKEILGAILKIWDQENTFISPANQNTKIALATQILRLPATCKIAAFEMGARRVNDFQVPLSFLQPQVVALANVGTAHIGEFGSLENLRSEKQSVLYAPSAKILICNADDEQLMQAARETGKRIVSFGLTANADIQVLGEDDFGVTLKIHQEPVNLSCPMISSAKGLNIATAVGLAMSLDIPLETIKLALKELKGISRRFDIFKWNETTCIDDAFNASPESMKTGLAKLSQIARGKRTLLVLGSMVELGTESEHQHRILADVLREYFGSDMNDNKLFLVTIGQDIQFLVEELNQKSPSPGSIYSFDSVDEARKYVQQTHSEFDFIYAKGSKALQVQKVFGDR
ncbi:MAG: Mur ligase family protein [Bdellovibrio sp.]